MKIKIDTQTITVMKIFYTGLFVAALCAMVSCKKDNTAVIPLTIVNSGTTITIKPLETFGITLADDSAFTYNTPQYNTQTLKFLSHSHAAASGPGDYGSDTWEFATTNQGTEPLTITATKGDSTVTVFNALISVQP